MNQTTILLPMIAVAVLTFSVLGLIPFQRLRAVLNQQVAMADFRMGESDRVPDAVALPNRNYMNLLELPVLFYLVCLALYVTETDSALALGLAWAYVALRCLHSVVHLTFNPVLTRLSVFALSNGVLMALWVVFMLAVLS